MKFSLNLAQYYSEIDLKNLPHAEIVSRIGAQLGSVEDVTDYSTKYEGIVVAKVITCEKHPNADKLSLCMIDDGGVVPNIARDDSGHVQVVCGAPNVAAGLSVAWIPPGATVPSTLDKEPFVLEARELRGKVSNGMLASAKELGLSDEHDGILEIIAEKGAELPDPGLPLSKYQGLDDLVIDCENKMFTHRPDCFGNLGIARELAGIFDMPYVSPEWYINKPTFQEVNDMQLNVTNDIKEAVPRFMAVVMQNVEMSQSPTWMQGYLTRLGMKPINNIVDITNYVMHLTGQPLHAFDYDKVKNISDSPSIFPRMAINGEKLTLLGNKEIILNENDIVISTDKQVVGLAGVMGGVDTEVDDNTRNIIIECANFDMYAIRRTSMRHGLFTDAVTRFNKGQSPLQNDRVMAYAMKLMSTYAQASQASNVYDISGFDVNNDNLSRVATSVNFINERLGTLLSASEIKNLLENVEFRVEIDKDELSITAPFWRMDISIPEDVVEEIGRLHGYHNVPVILPARTSKPSQKNEIREYKQTIRNTLVTLGANEVLTYSFVHGDLLRNTGTDPAKWAYHLRNALSPDLQYYRTSLIPSLLAKVHKNLKAQAGSISNEFALFELGKVHIKDHFDEIEMEIPKQMRRLAMVLVADKKTAKSYSGSAYYQAKKYVDEITNGQATYSPLENTSYPITGVYQKNRSATVTMGRDGTVIGVIGEFNQKAKKALKLPEYCAGFEIDTDLLQKYVVKKPYRQLSQFPPVSQDITYEAPQSMSWSSLHDFISAELQVAHAQDGYDFELSPLTIYQEEDSDKKRISFRVIATHPHKTLLTGEIVTLLDRISEAISDRLQVIRI